MASVSTRTKSIMKNKAKFFEEKTQGLTQKKSTIKTKLFVNVCY